MFISFIHSYHSKKKHKTSRAGGNIEIKQAQRAGKARAESVQSAVFLTQ